MNATIQLLVGYAEPATRVLGSRLECEARDQGVPLACRSVRLVDVPATVAATPPDVLLLENRPDGTTDAFRVLHEARLLWPAAHALMVNDACSADVVIECIRQGASGCVPASGDLSLFVKAICAVNAGESWFGRLALLHALQRLLFAAPATALINDAGLTRREGEVLRLISSGMSNKEIARELDISDMTVKTHVHHIYVKLHQSGRYKILLSNATGHLGGLAGDSSHEGPAS